MAFYTDPIHGRLKTLIKTIGGYDFGYHIEKVANENNIDKNIVIEIFRMTTNEDRRKKYIELYKEGKTLEYLQELNRVAVDRSVNGFSKLARLLYSSGVRSDYLDMFSKPINKI